MKPSEFMYEVHQASQNSTSSIEQVATTLAGKIPLLTERRSWETPYTMQELTLHEQEFNNYLTRVVGIIKALTMLKVCCVDETEEAGDPTEDLGSDGAASLPKFVEANPL